MQRIDNDHAPLALEISRHSANMQAVKNEITYVRLDPTVKRALVRIAAEDRRSLTSLIGKILADWVKAQKGSK